MVDGQASQGMGHDPSLYTGRRCEVIKTRTLKMTTGLVDVDVSDEEITADKLTDDDAFCWVVMVMMGARREE